MITETIKNLCNKESLSNFAGQAVEHISYTAQWGARQAAAFYSGPVVDTVVTVWNKAQSVTGIRAAGPIVVFGAAWYATSTGRELWHIQKSTFTDGDWDEYFPLSNTSKLITKTLGLGLIVLGSAAVAAGTSYAGYSNNVSIGSGILTAILSFR